MKPAKVYSLAEAFKATRDLAEGYAHQYNDGRRAGERGDAVDAWLISSPAFLRGLREGYAARAGRLHDLASAAFTLGRAAIADGKPAARHFDRWQKLSDKARELDAWSGRGE